MNRPKILMLLDLLEKKYPHPEIALSFANPLDLLIATILSAQCTDKRVNEVTKTLFQRYRTPKDYAHADLDTFQEEIRSTGFYKNKAKTIISCTKKIENDFEGRVPSTMEELTSLPGVGRKTASVVLGGAFNTPSIAVDTHVLLVSNRIGLVNEKDPVKVEMHLRKVIPENRWIFYTLSVILHGRETCKARSPRCGECIVYKVCKWPGKKKA